MGAIISVLVLAILIQATGANDFGEGLLVGVFAGVGFIGTSPGHQLHFRVPVVEAIPD